MSNEKILSVSAVLALPSDSWVNGGLRAVCSHQERKVSSKTNKPFWKIEFTDQENGALLKSMMFFAPKFSEGQVVELTGSGLKFKNGQYGPELSIGDKAVITVLGHSSPPPEPQNPTYGHADQSASAASRYDHAGTPVFGATVGMAINQALENFRHCYAPADFAAMMKTPFFSAALHEQASDIIRVSRMLEAGKLAAPVKVRAGGHPDLEAAPGHEQEAPAHAHAGGNQPAFPNRTAPPANQGRSDPPRTGKSQPGPDGSVALGPDVEDCPF